MEESALGRYPLREVSAVEVDQVSDCKRYHGDIQALFRELSTE